MCGIFTYHFKNIDGKNVGKSTVPPTGSTTKIPAKKKNISRKPPSTTIHSSLPGECIHLYLGGTIHPRTYLFVGEYWRLLDRPKSIGPGSG